MFATRCLVSTNALIPTDHSCVNAMLDMCSVLTRGPVMVCLYTKFSLFYCILRTLSLTKDINECAVNSKLCANGSSCVNTNGSYTCQCSNGYPQLNGTCKSKEYIILN